MLTVQGQSWDYVVAYSRNSFLYFERVHYSEVMELWLSKDYASLYILVISQLRNRESSTDLDHKNLSPKTLTCYFWREQLHFK